MGVIVQLLTAVVLFLKALPEVISIIREVIKLISKEDCSAKKLEKAKEIKEAVKDARVLKDTTKIENLFGIKTTTEEVVVEKFEVVSSPTARMTFVAEKKSPELEALELAQATALEISEAKVIPILPQGKVNIPSAPSPLPTKSKAGSVLSKMAAFAFGGSVAPVIESDIIYHNMGEFGSARIYHKYIPPAVIAFLVLFAGCQGTPLKDKITFRPKVYMGASALGGLYRSQDESLISCKDGVFDDYLCMSLDDFEKMVESTDFCK